MPQSRTRKGADAKRKAAQARKTAERQDANAEEQAAQAPTAAERRRAKRAEHDAGTSASKKSADSKASGSKASGSKTKATGAKSTSTKSVAKSAETAKSGTRRRTTAERRGVANKGGVTQVRRGPASRRWVPPTFITAFLLGVAWLIVYYVAGTSIPIMGDLGNWNILIGMGLMAISFIIATLWK